MGQRPPALPQDDLGREAPVPSLHEGGQEVGEVDPIGVGVAEDRVRAVEDEPVAAAGRLDPMQEASEARVLDDVPEVPGSLHVDADRGIEEGLGLAEVVVRPEILCGVVAGERARRWNS